MGLTGVSQTPCVLNVCGHTFWVGTGSGDEDDGIVLVQIDVALLVFSFPAFNVLYHDGVGFCVMSHLFRHHLAAVVCSS